MTKKKEKINLIELHPHGFELSKEERDYMDMIAKIIGLHSDDSKEETNEDDKEKETKTD